MRSKNRVFISKTGLFSGAIPVCQKFVPKHGMMTPRNIYIYLRWVKTIKLWEFTYQYTEISHHTKCGFHQSVLPPTISTIEHGYNTSTIYLLVMLYEHHHCVPYLCQEILGVHPKDTYYLSYMYNYISKNHRY